MPPTTMSRPVVTVHVDNRNLTTDSRFAIGFVRNPVDAVRAAHKFEPVNHRAGIPLRTLAMM